MILVYIFGALFAIKFLQGIGPAIREERERNGHDA